MQLATCPDTTSAHRLGSAVLTVTAADGAPVADTEVEVAQLRHAFAFGNIGFDLIDLANGRGADGDAALADRWLELFNTATLPFYWGTFEPEEGATRTGDLLATAAWFADRGVRLKGHPLVWHTVQPRWLLGRPSAEVEPLLRERIRREVTAFREYVGAWDAINEVVIMPVFTAEENAITPLARSKGRIATVRLAFEEARAADPSATLLINDFDLSSAYERLIEGLLEAGVGIDAIGLQTHMHQGYRGEEQVQEVVERFSRFGLPLHFTETSLVSGHLMPPDIVDLNDYVVESWPSTPDGEVRQADELVRHYRCLVAQPSVEAITYWGITDAGAWLAAPIGLVRADGSPKPSFAALRDLIKGEWWLPPTRLRTDAAGQVGVRGFAGDYEATLDGHATGFTLTPAADVDVEVHPLP
ncbi:MAG: endo-1,4-beta-xylanase [Propionicimonas sp.]|uniref:endo-1,4-beta-xylanase n=1 Tax=Propionicimonas sp. TaxID=1955623 RepID=UPI003D140C1B